MHHYELKQYASCFVAEYFTYIDWWNLAKLLRLQNPRQIKRNDLNFVRRETGRHFGGEKKYIWKIKLVSLTQTERRIFENSVDT